jgi:hypothetical protein
LDPGPPSPDSCPPNPDPAVVGRDLIQVAEPTPVREEALAATPRRDFGAASPCLMEVAGGVREVEVEGEREGTGLRDRNKVYMSTFRSIGVRLCTRDRLKLQNEQHES